MNLSKKKELIYLHIAVMLWGFTGLFGREISLTQVPLVWWRMLFTVIIFAVVLRGLNRPLVAQGSSKLRVAIVGVLIMLHWLCFYGAIKHSNVSIGLCCLSLGAVATSFIEPFYKKRKINWTEVLLGGLSVLGIAIILKFQYQYKLGIALGVMAAVLAALFTVLNEQLSKENDAIALSMNELLYGFLGLTLLLPIVHYLQPHLPLMPSWRDVQLLLVFSSVCTVVPFVLSILAMRRLSAYTVTLSVNLEPVYGILAAFVIFKEYQQLNTGFFVGSICIIASVISYAIYSWYLKKKM